METLTSLNWLDIALALIIVISAIAGLRAGFTRVVIGLVALVRAVFVAVPGVIVLVGLIIVALVVLALLFFVILVVLCVGSGHERYGRGKGGSQKKCAQISVSTVHVVLL